MKDEKPTRRHEEPTRRGGDTETRGRGRYEEGSRSGVDKFKRRNLFTLSIPVSPLLPFSASVLHPSAFILLNNPQARVSPAISVTAFP
jgi:hypothetical protein